MDEEVQQTGETNSPDVRTGKSKTMKTAGSSASNTPRKRVSQACDRCRSRKDKCDGKKPVCSTCAAQGQVCSYDPATKKRGLPEGYVRGLEKLWGLTIREVDCIEDNILGMLSGGTDILGYDTLSGVWNDREGSETLLETWRKSRLSRELDRILPILDSVEDKPAKRKRPESGPSRIEANAELSQPAPQAIDLDQRLYGEDLCGTQDDLLGIIPNHLPQRRRMIDITDIPVEVPESTAAPPNLPTRTWHLLDVFFSYTHCWLPIVEKHDVLRVSYQYSHRAIEVSTSQPGSGDHAALWAILAYADSQNDAIGKKVFQDDTQWTTDGLYERARSLIPKEDGVFELGHIQALLILTLFNMGKDQWKRGWLLIGHAVRIAVNLGLNEGVQGNPLQFNTADKKSRNHHVFLGCFALDTLVAAQLGRIPQLRREEIDHVGTIEEDGLDEWNPWLDCLAVRRLPSDGPHGPTAVLSTFNQFIALLKILNSVIRDLSRGKRRVENCTEFLNELDSWGQVLPTMFATSKPPLLPHRFNLHMAHISTIAVVYSHLSSSSKEMQISDLRITETFATTARQVMWLLVRQAERFGLLTVPPTYEYFTKVACESGFKVRDHIGDETITFNEWKRNMERSLASMEKAWPAFGTLKALFPVNNVTTTHQYQATGAPIAQSEPFEDPVQIPSHTKQPSISDSVFSFNGGIGSPITSRNFAGQSNATYSHPQLDPLLSLAASAGLHGLEESSPSWPENQSRQTPYGDKVSADQFRLHDGSISSEIDGDSMFNDFATLDAMEWTNNWDQSLLNLGFTDSDNMSQDFYIFCREPDPLYSNNLVQQLLSSSNVDAGGVLGESGISISNPHVEASQILQALATAQSRGTAQGYT